MPNLSPPKLERRLYAAADILRREGMDAATYKDFIVGMLFLKRCSDTFDAQHGKIVAEKVAGGMARAEVETQYVENSDFYNSFFAPPRARWAYLQERLNDGNEPCARRFLVFDADLDAYQSPTVHYGIRVRRGS